MYCKHQEYFILNICIWYEKLPIMHDWVVKNYKLQLFGCMLLSDLEVYRCGGDIPNG